MKHKFAQEFVQINFPVKGNCLANDMSELNKPLLSVV